MESILLRAQCLFHEAAYQHMIRSNHLDEFLFSCCLFYASLSTAVR